MEMGAGIHFLYIIGSAEAVPPPCIPQRINPPVGHGALPVPTEAYPDDAGAGSLPARKKRESRWVLAGLPYIVFLMVNGKMGAGIQHFSFRV